MSQPVPRTGAQRALKVFAVLIIITGALSLAIGGIFIGGGAAINSLALSPAADGASLSDTIDPDTMADINAFTSQYPESAEIINDIISGDATTGLEIIFFMAVILGAILVISGIYSIVVGALGVRASNHPAHTTPFFVLTIIDIALQACSIIVSFFSPSGLGFNGLWSYIPGLAFAIVCLVLVIQVRNQYKAGVAVDNSLQ